MYILRSLRAVDLQPPWNNSKSVEMTNSLAYNRDDNFVDNIRWSMEISFFNDAFWGLLIFSVWRIQKKRIWIATAKVSSLRTRKEKKKIIEGNLLKIGFFFRWKEFHGKCRERRAGEAFHQLQFMEAPARPANCRILSLRQRRIFWCFAFLRLFPFLRTVDLRCVVVDGSLFSGPAFLQTAPKRSQKERRIKPTVDCQQSH